MVRSSLPLTSPRITMLFPMLTDSCFIGRCSPPRVSPIPPVAINGSVATLAAFDGGRGVSSRFHIGVTSIAPTVPFGPADLPLLARTGHRSRQYRRLRGSPSSFVEGAPAEYGNPTCGSTPTPAEAAALGVSVAMHHR